MQTTTVAISNEKELSGNLLTHEHAGDILSSFIEQVKDYAIFLLDKEGCILTWNTGAESIKGYKEAEVAGKHISIFYIEEDVKHNVPAHNLNQAATLGRYEAEGWRLRKDGSPFWANVIFTALYNGDGTVKGFAKITRDITQRKQNEDKLASLAVIIQNTSDAIFSTTTALNILTWNRGAESLYGYTAEEVLGKTTLATIKPKITEAFLQERNGIIAAKGYWSGEITHQHKNGYPVIVAASISALYDAENQVNGYIFITRDITAQKAAEEKINYLANIVEQTSDAIYSYDAGLKIVSWNKAAEHIYGYTATEALNADVALLLKPQIEKIKRVQIRQQIKENGYWDGELVQTRKNGTPVHLYFSVTALRDDDGAIVEQICICRDITLKKKAEETESRLKKQLDDLLQNKLDSTLKALSDYKYALDKSSIIAITNQKGIIEHVNENFCTISGYSKEELLGNDHRIINSGYHDKAFIKNLWTTIAQGRIWKGEIRNRAKGGTFYWVDTTIIPFLNDEGKPYQYVAIRADITNRKKAEEALHTLNEQLEERIKARTIQLETANKEMEAFSYSISHDLRAPLRGINGFARILTEEFGALLGKEGNRLLSKVTGNALTMSRLIDDLLDFTRLGKTGMVCTNVNMDDLVKSCLEDMVQNAALASVQLNIGHLPPCRGDTNMLKQVWFNLLSNAVKYSSKKTRPCITINAKEDNGNLVYLVQDNGDGFDMQYYNQLFGVFQRLHSNDQFEGTGVGLAIVKLIITKHGGEVWAESVTGEGATFYFSLPKQKI